MPKITVQVAVIPASGEPTSKTVEVETTGATLGDVLKAAKLSGDRMQITVGGEPATLKTLVSSNQTVTLTERASGS